MLGEVADGGVVRADETAVAQLGEDIGVAVEGEQLTVAPANPSLPEGAGDGCGASPTKCVRTSCACVGLRTQGSPLSAGDAAISDGASMNECSNWVRA